MCDPGNGINVGRCALCLQVKELQFSHYIAAGFFKAVLQGYEPFDTAPVLIDGVNNIAIYSNQQPTKYLLCTDCETKFADRGENTVIRACHGKNGRFRLRERLKALCPSTYANQKAVYFGNALPSDLASKAYVYFALSVIWRGAVTAWGGSFDQIRLGSRYQEEIRKFLNDEAPFPNIANVIIYVDFDDPPVALIALPTFRKITIAGRQFFQHSFLIPGMRVIVLVGQSVPEIENLTPSSERGQPTFFQWSFRNAEIFEGVLGTVKQTKRKGKLANEK